MKSITISVLFFFLAKKKTHSKPGSSETKTSRTTVFFQSPGHILSLT